MDNFNLSRFLKFQKQSGELYQSLLEEAAKDVGLTRPEAEVLLFFAHYPEFTLASDAVRMRGFSKSYVSKAVDGLVANKLVEVNQDLADRRLQHIKLTEQSSAIIADLQRAPKEFFALLTVGLSTEDKNLLKQMVERLMANVEQAHTD